MVCAAAIAAVKLGPGTEASQSVGNRTVQQPAMTLRQPLVERSDRLSSVPNQVNLGRLSKAFLVFVGFKAATDSLNSKKNPKLMS